MLLCTSQRALMLAPRARLWRSYSAWLTPRSKTISASYPYATSVHPPPSVDMSQYTCTPAYSCLDSSPWP